VSLGSELVCGGESPRCEGRRGTRIGMYGWDVLWRDEGSFNHDGFLEFRVKIDVGD
jgi:hypothetical protein